MPAAHLSLAKFRTSSLNRCWTFCRYFKSCIVFSYEYDVQTCFLFPRIKYRVSVADAPSTVLTASKHCIRGRRCGENGVSDLALGQGWLVRDMRYPLSDKCMTALKYQYLKEVGGQGKTRQVKVESFNLMLSPCYSTQNSSNTWNLQLKRSAGPPKRGIEITLELSSGVVPDEDKPCIGFRSNQWEQSLFIYKCKKKGGNTISLRYQRYPFKDCSTRIAGGGGRSGKDEVELSIEFRDKPVDYTDDALVSENLCYLSNESILYGYLKHDSDSPYQLPGQIITVRCLDTFGVNELDFAPEYNITCSSTIRFLTCVKAPIMDDLESTAVSSTPSQMLINENHIKTLLRPKLSDPFVFSSVFLASTSVILVLIFSAAGLCKLVRHLMEIRGKEEDPNSGLQMTEIGG